MFATVAALILVNALYVAAEFAAVGARASRVEQFAAEGSRLAVKLLPIVRDTVRLDRYIAACQIGITLSSLGLGAFGQATLGIALGASLVERMDMAPISAYATSATVVLVLLTSLQVVLGELIPKTVALQYPVRTAIYTFVPMQWSLLLFSPFIRFLNGSGNVVLRIMGLHGGGHHRHLHSSTELEMLVRESGDEGLLGSGQSLRLREALRLRRRSARQLMVPRRQIASIDLDDALDVQLAAVQDSPYTRLVVHRGGLDNVRGFLHVKDLAAAVAGGSPLASLAPLLRPLLALPGGLTVDRVLGQLRERRARLALVVSEFGDVEGLISLEDVVRELLGGLSDEFKDGSDIAAQPLDDGRWRLPGRMPLDEAAEWAGAPALAAAWRNSEAETLAGWLMERFDAVPVPGQRLRHAQLSFEVEAMDGSAIVSVLATRPAGQDEQEERDHA
ncbi:hemolysin family protein [soil metagenome]